MKSIPDNIAISYSTSGFVDRDLDAALDAIAVWSENSARAFFVLISSLIGARKCD
jgi:hypothetical protein